MFEKIGEGWRKPEKVGDGRRRPEKLGDGWGKLVNVEEGRRKVRTITNNLILNQVRHILKKYGKA